MAHRFIMYHTEYPISCLFISASHNYCYKNLPNFYIPSLQDFCSSFISLLRVFYFIFWQIHWFSIFNSFMMVIFLTGLVSMILMRTLRNDYAKYAREDDDLESLVMSPQLLFVISCTFFFFLLLLLTSSLSNTSFFIYTCEAA